MWKYQSFEKLKLSTTYYSLLIGKMNHLVLVSVAVRLVDKTIKVWNSQYIMLLINKYNIIYYIRTQHVNDPTYTIKRERGVYALYFL